MLLLAINVFEKNWMLIRDIIIYKYIYGKNIQLNN